MSEGDKDQSPPVRKHDIHGSAIHPGAASEQAAAQSSRTSPGCLSAKPLCPLLTRSARRPCSPAARKRRMARNTAPYALRDAGSTANNLVLAPTKRYLPKHLYKHQVTRLPTQLHTSPRGCPSSLGWVTARLARDCPAGICYYAAAGYSTAAPSSTTARAMEVLQKARQNRPVPGESGAAGNLLQ